LVVSQKKPIKMGYGSLAQRASSGGAMSKDQDTIRRFTWVIEGIWAAAAMIRDEQSPPQERSSEPSASLF
jgi:hypothetical protein